MSITAIYQLPVPIWISTDVLGERIRSGYRGFEFDVFMPTDIAPVGGAPVVPCVEVPAVESDADLVVWAVEFAAEASDPNSTALCRVVVQTLESHDPVNGPSDLARAMERWFDAVRTWAETLTGQDLDPNHRVFSSKEYGEHLTLLDPAPATNGPIALSLSIPHVVPVSASEWRMLLARVAAGEEPPLEEQLNRDARAAFNREQYRRSVIDAASAAEIVLHRLIATSVTEAQLPNSEYRRRLLKLDMQPLGDLVKIADAAGVDVEVDGLAALVRVRNDAIHRGAAPSIFDAYQAGKAATRLLGCYGEWKRAGSAATSGASGT